MSEPFLLCVLTAWREFILHGRGFVFVLMLGLVLPNPAGAQGLDGKSLVSIVAPYVNDTTIAVGHADVQKVDVNKYFDMLAAFLGDTHKDVNDLYTFVRAQKALLVKAGVRHVLAVVNITELNSRNLPEVVVVAPLKKNADVADLLKLIGQIPGVTAKVESATLLVRLGADKGVRPRERPEFGEGLDALTDQHIRMVAAPAESLRTLAETLVPQLPAALGGGATTLLTRGIRWLGVGYDTSALTQHYILQAKDERAAQQLKEVADKGLELLAQQGSIPAGGKVRDLLAPKRQGDRLVLAFKEQAVRALLGPSVDQIRQATRRTEAINNLKQIGLGMLNYESTYHRFPARASFDRNGKPLLSWRVHLLPYIEQEELYKQFKLDEPWNSAANKKLIERIPKTYSSPFSNVSKEGKTTYLVPTGKGSMFEGTEGVRVADVTDGLANTIMVLEATDSRAVTWTEPEDFALGAENPLAGLVHKELQGILAAFADVTVILLSPSLPPATLQALFTRSAGEEVHPADHAVRSTLR